MTMRRLLQTVLVSFVLVAGGCSFFQSSNSNTPTNKNANSPSRSSANTAAPNNKPVNWDAADRHVQDAIDKVLSQKRPAYTPKDVAADVKEAMRELGKDEEDLKARCEGCQDETIIAGQQALVSLTEVQKILQSPSVTELNSQIKGQVGTQLTNANLKLQEAMRSNTPPASPSPRPASTSRARTWPSC